jgi:hypothetical protein
LRFISFAKDFAFLSEREKLLLLNIRLEAKEENRGKIVFLKKLPCILGGKPRFLLTRSREDHSLDRSNPVGVPFGRSDSLTRKVCLSYFSVLCKKTPEG